MWNRGKLVIVGIVGLAVAAALFSLWYHLHGGHRLRDYWGMTTARLIVEAPEIRALKLEAVAPPPDEPRVEPEPPEGLAVEYNDRFWKVTHEQHVDRAPGVGNIRHALIQDASFEWSGQPPKGEPDWQYALQFDDGKIVAMVLFDFSSRRLALAGGRRTVRLSQAAADDWRSFFEEQLADAPPPSELPATEPGDESPPEKPTAEKAPAPKNSSEEPPAGQEPAPPRSS